MLLHSHAQVVQHYRQERVGHVTCKILGETPQPEVFRSQRSLQDGSAGGQPAAGPGASGAFLAATALVPAPPPPAAAAAAAGPGGLVPLLQLVGLAPGIPPSALGLLYSLLQGWYVVRDAQVAAAVQAACRKAATGAAPSARISLVTQAGEVFKADGEIVVAARAAISGEARPVTGPYW